MLGAIAAIVLAVGTLSSAVSVTQHDNKEVDRFDEPVVAVQVFESSDYLSE
jgi:hypothetical protein